MGICMHMGMGIGMSVGVTGVIPGFTGEELDGAERAVR